MRNPDQLTGSPPTKTAWIDDLVRAAIIDGELEPGSRLVLAALAERFDVSVTPLREALARLAVDGFVELRPHGSARVAPISIDDAEEVYAIRRLLEPVALRAAIEVADDGDRGRWQTAFDVMAAAHADGAPRLDRLHAHADFHRSLLSSCPSTWMLRTLGPLRDHSLRVVAAIAETKHVVHQAGDHVRLLDLAMEGDVDGAATLLEEHLDASMSALRARHEEVSADA